jgi:serine/threonine-protein kinase
MALAAGDKLGPYEILAPVGSGGMGEVWKARDTRLDRIVAVKRLKGGHSARFEQEARTIAALNHPHICQIYDVGPDYLVMEYIDGAPLRGSLPVEEAVRLAIQIVGALEAAHRKNIIHRDLKPANILVTGGVVKLLDFGLAKLMPSADTEATATMEGMVAGTAAYMSPEQAQGKPLDVRSDIFSFGAVLYEMVSGDRAFGGDSMVDVLSAIVRDEPRPLRGSPEIARIVTRCLRKVSAERFQNVAEIKAALESVATCPGGQQPSIAVLPFANMSADREQDYFSDGLSEEIINLLAHVPGLKVTARTSAFAFRGREQDIRKIAEALNVRAILEGSVRRAGSRIRVTAQLIDAHDGYHLWSERYDREMIDVFAIQDEIAQAITTALQVKLSVRHAAFRHHKPDLAAYEAYLKARHHIDKLTPQSLQRAKEYLEEAIALDPKFALAHIEHGNYFLNRALSGLLPAHEAMPLARASGQRAMDLDPSLPEGHAMLGIVAGVYDYNWKEAGRRFGLAMTGDAIPPAVHDLYGFFYLLPAGRPLEALEELERAVKEDPLGVVVRMHYATCLLAAGKEAEGEVQLQQVLELDENFRPALSIVGLNHTLHGRLAEALACLEKAHALAPWIPNVIGLLAGVMVRSGNVGGAKELLEKLRPGRAYGAPRGLAVFHLLCGDVDQGADWAEKAIEQRDPLMIFFLRLTFAKALRSSARWPALARMMNLVEAT